MTRTFRAFLAAVIALASAAASAQAYPTKPIKLLVGFAAGGPTDVIGRVVAQDMTASLGQNVLVENKAGANSLIATQEVVARPARRLHADGDDALAQRERDPAGRKKLYDPIADFAPVSLVALLPLVMVTKPESQFNSVQDVVKAAKAKPGEVSYGSAGNGGSAHLAARAAREALGHADDARAVPRQRAGAHRGHGGTRHLHVLSDDRHRRSGGAEASESARRRHAEAPRGLSRACRRWPRRVCPASRSTRRAWACSRPPATPAPVVNRLNKAVRASLAKPETKEKLRALGAITEGGSTPRSSRRG